MTAVAFALVALVATAVWAGSRGPGDVRAASPGLRLDAEADQLRSRIHGLDSPRHPLRQRPARLRSSDGVLRSAAGADALWSRRRDLFFKPAAGHGSKAAYRGEKITRRVWSEVLAGSYVAQELVLPSERHTSASTRMKVDVRNYAYAGRVQLLAARLYQGQTTNMRTPGGGFAPVVELTRQPAGA